MLTRLRHPVVYGLLATLGCLGLAAIVWAAIPSGAPVTYTGFDTVTLPAGVVFNAPTVNVTSTFTAVGALVWSGVITPPQLTADQDDYGPAGLATASELRVSTNASRQLRGVQGGASGRVMTIVNVGSQPLTLVHEATTSTAANRFALTANLVLGPNAGTALKYDGTAARWRSIPAVLAPAVLANQSLLAGATIQHSGRTDVIEILQVSGSGGAVINTANPRIAPGQQGQMIVLQGTSATNTYTLPDGQGVKLRSGVDALFDDRASTMFRYDTGLATWRELNTFGGTGGGGAGGGTAASVSFTPTGGISSGNVQSGMVEIDAEAEKLANKNTNNGYIGANATGKVPWNRRDTPFVHGDLSATSQIDVATAASSVIAIQSSLAGNITLTTGNPRLTGCTAGNDGVRILLVGLSTTKTVTIPNGQGVLLPGGGPVVIGALGGGALGGSAEFRCRGSDNTWVQSNVPAARQVFDLNPAVTIYTCGDAKNPVFDGGSGNKWEFCLDATNTPSINGFCGGVACTFTTLRNAAFASSGSKPTCDATIAASKLPFWVTIAPATDTAVEVCKKNASDVYAWASLLGGGGGGSTPGGSTTQVQFNDAGVLGGDPGFTYNKTTDVVTASGGFVGNLTGNATGNFTVGGNLTVSGGTVAMNGALTGATLDAAATGNNVTVPAKRWLPMAGCNGTTAAPIWDLPATNPAVAACVTGTNTQKAVLNFADGANLSAQIIERLPAGWTKDIGVVGTWYSTTGSTNTVVWQVQVSCVADGEPDDPAWDSDVLAMPDAGKGTALQTNTFAGTLLASSHLSGCAGGELLHLKVFRDSAHGSDNFAGTAGLIGMELTVWETH